MKNLIQYNYSCCNAFYNYLKSYNLETLKNELYRIEVHAVLNNNSKDIDLNKNLWFKFGKDDTLTTTIKDILNDLALPHSHKNKQYLLECFKNVCGLNPSNELEVYYS